MEPKSKKQTRSLQLCWFCALTSSTAFWRKPSSCSKGPNNFVNLCVEGILDAMDAPGTDYDIPILSLYNQVKGSNVSHL